MIGLSLSFCVRDVIDGYLDVASIDKIITGTSVPPDNDWSNLINRYCAVYWRKAPNTAQMVFSQLWETGRIEQSDDPENHVINFGHWRLSDGEFTYPKFGDSVRMVGWVYGLQRDDHGAEMRGRRTMIFRPIKTS